MLTGAHYTFYSYFHSKETVCTEVAQRVVKTMMESLHTEFVPGLDQARPGHKLTDRRNLPIRCGPASTGS